MLSIPSAPDPIRWFVAFVSLVWATFVHAQEVQDPSATHGMLLFGKDEIFVSHLPMFRSPHDYQVIARITLPEEIREIYLEQRVQSPDKTVFTLVPEKFVLPDMIRSPRPFRARLYVGHFERGGEAITEDFPVTLSRVLYFQKFDVDATRDDRSRYLVFGNESEVFLAHHITAKPDFDQVCAVSQPESRLVHAIKSAGAGLIMEFVDRENKPISIPEVIGTVGNRSYTLNLHSLYLEFYDLAH